MTLRPSQNLRRPVDNSAGPTCQITSARFLATTYLAGCSITDSAAKCAFPRLAGQHRAYLIEQLHKFRTGVHLYPGARFMREVAKRMTEEEIRAVAEYVSAK